MIALALAVLVGLLAGSVATFLLILWLASRSPVMAPDEPARPEPKEPRKLTPEGEDRAFAEEMYDNIVAQRKEELRQELYADAHEPATALNDAFSAAYQRAQKDPTYEPGVSDYEVGWTAIRDKLREMDVDALLALHAALRESHWNDGDDPLRDEFAAAVRVEMDIRVWQGTPSGS